MKEKANSLTYNEADTRANLIDPKLNMAGWTRSQVTREHYYRPDFEYTAGRVVLRGDQAESSTASARTYTGSTWGDANDDRSNQR